MRSIREHLKKISDNSEQTCKVREHLKKIGDNSEQNYSLFALIFKGVHELFEVHTGGV